MKKTRAVSLLFLASIMYHTPAHSYFREKASNILNRDAEKFDKLNSVVKKISTLGDLYNRVMLKNTTIVQTGNQKIEENRKFILDMQRDILELTTKLATLIPNALADIENQKQQNEKKLLGLHPETSTLQQENQQGMAAKAFWGALSPLTATYGVMASVLEQAADKTKAIVGAQTNEKIKTTLKEKIQEGEKDINFLKNFIKAPSNSTYLGKHPEIMPIMNNIQRVQDKLEKSTQVLDAYWKQMALETKNVTYLGDTDSSKLQEDITRVVNELCAMPSWVEAVKINKTNNPVTYTYTPSVALEKCIKKYEPK